jgi:hypothetical protein
LDACTDYENRFILSTLMIGNLLEAVKYKIVGLKHPQLTKGILQKSFNALMEKPKMVPTG